jgi:hypothetical protein
MFWSAIVLVSTTSAEGDMKNDIKNKESADESMEYISPFVVPAPMFYYGFHYPILAPGLFMSIFVILTRLTKVLAYLPQKELLFSRIANTKIYCIVHML